MRNRSPSKGVRLLRCFAVVAVGGFSLPSSADDACHWDEPWPEAPPAILLHEDDPLALALRDQWQEGANFACSARLVTLGCGTGCVSGAIYDAATQAWQPLGFAVHRGLRQETPMLSFAADSRDLEVKGFLNEEEAVHRIYRWDGGELLEHHEEPGPRTGD